MNWTPSGRPSIFEAALAIDVTTCLDGPKVMLGRGFLGAGLLSRGGGRVAVFVGIVCQLLIATWTYGNDVLAGVTGEAGSGRFGGFVRRFGRSGSRAWPGRVPEGRRPEVIIEMYGTQSECLRSGQGYEMRDSDVALARNDDVVIGVMVAVRHSSGGWVVVQELEEGYALHELCDGTQAVVEVEVGILVLRMCWWLSGLLTGPGVSSATAVEVVVVTIGVVILEVLVAEEAVAAVGCVSPRSIQHRPVFVVGTRDDDDVLVVNVARVASV